MLFQRKKMHSCFNNRQKMILSILLASLFLMVVIVIALSLDNSRITINFSVQKLPPSFEYLFGTDWLGRDMFARTLKGLLLSVRIGIISSIVSVIVALVLGIMSATLGKWVDGFISWMIDLFLGIPHIPFMILISFAFGGGAKGLVIAVASTHWPALARIIRAEVLQVKTAHYVNVSFNMGKSNIFIAIRHILPHVLPQLFVGFILLFPHAILHEAALTFLGFGLSPLKPAIGVILSEALTYLSTGMWWLVFFPGLALLLVVRSFDIVGSNMNKLLDPYTSQE